jgi:predicted acetyltransferase
MLASLRASEGVIYSRFGFGVAGDANGVVVDAPRARPVQGRADGSFRLLHADEMRALLPAIYERAAHRPGAISRSAFIWDRVLKEAMEGKKATFVVVHTSPAGDDGYAIYSVEWEHAPLSEVLGQCTLHELFGASPAVELALWDYMVNISLMRTVTAECRPVDDLVRRAIPDPRAYDVKLHWDEQWVRLLRVEEALSARSYGAGAPVTIRVDDPWYAENCATFEVSSDGVRRVDTDGELRAPIDALSATYLGAVAWRDLTAIGRVTGSYDAAARADALFAHHPTTWSGTFF